MALTNAMGAALSGLSAQQFRLDVVGDNLANSSTPGFRTARVDFESLLAETLRTGNRPEGEWGGVDPLQVGLGTGVAGVTRSFDVPGVIQATGPSGDLAIDGIGFFILGDGAGGALYTRDGSFGLDAAGRLHDPATGLALQGEAGDLVLPAGFSGFDVQADGTVLASLTAGGTVTAGRVLLARFINPDGLERDERGLFRAGANSGSPVTAAPGSGGLGSLVGESLETSNVDFTEQFGELISAQRAFQANARVLNRSEQLLEALMKIV